LEWACRAAALRGAITDRLPRGVALFINAEPSHLGTAAPIAVRVLETQIRQRTQVVLELTERELVRRPADVLRAVYAAREMGWGIALDDVGVEPASLALMPVVRPDVVKLDMSLIQQPTSPARARVAGAVAAYAEESGAHVLAEGIETDLHLEQAIALGATLGQGWRFGRPGPLDQVARLRCDPIPLIQDIDPPCNSSPFELVGRPFPTRVGRKSQLLAMSHHLEGQATEHTTPPLLLSAFEEAAFFTPATQKRYAAYAVASPLVAAFGVGLSEEPAPGVRGESLASSDPLASEWTVVVLGPHFAGALIARDLGDARSSHDRRFEFAVTHDRRRVTTAARSLVQRIAAQS
jgi:EAL domain-containing protein (putative c-di-GMP-specific phosphodiesterase class I)